MHVHDVIEVARAAAFAERTQLLPEQLDERVTDDTFARQGVAVLMADRTLHDLLDDDLVGCEVELHLG